MPTIIPITDFAAPELDIYARLTENQLLNRANPANALFVAESPLVIGRALDAGCTPVSFLMETKHVNGKGAEILARCPADIPVYAAELEVLTQLTGFHLTRGMLCAMRRPPLPTVEEICAMSRRIAVLENVMNPTNIGAIFRSAAALGMDAGYLRTKIKDTASISPARSADVPNWKRVEGAYDTIPLGQMYLLGHGDLIISAQDLAQFAIALAGDGSTKTHRILSTESVKAINTVYSHSGKDGIGLNMSMTKDLADGRLIYGHSGQAYGMIAGLYFDPVDHTGVVFITNSASTAKNRKGKYTLTGNLMEILYRDVLGAPAYKGGPIAAPTGSIPMPEDKG